MSEVTYGKYDVAPRFRFRAFGRDIPAHDAGCASDYREDRSRGLFTIPAWAAFRDHLCIYCGTALEIAGCPAGDPSCPRTHKVPASVATVPGIGCAL